LHFTTKTLRTQRQKMKISFRKKIPKKQLLNLYNSHNWTAYTKEPERLMKAFENSTLIVSAWSDNEKLLGVARAVTDKLTIFYLQDIIVLPECEHQGIGQKLIKAALEKYPDIRQKVLMTDDDPRILKFYEKQGFKSIKSMEKLNVFVKFDS